MKRFIGSLVLISLITAFIIVLLFALRLVFWDHLVSKALSLSDDVEVVCIGNSHTGCSWVESAEFKNKKIWHTGTGFLYALFRLRELERLGELRKVKICIMDCDDPALAGFKKENIKSNLFQQLPIAWRYIDDVPLPKMQLVGGVLEHAFDRWSIINEFPLGWATRQWNLMPEAYRERHINNIKRRKHDAQNPMVFIPKWKNKFMSCIEEAKEICKRNNVRLILFASPLTSDFPRQDNMLAVMIDKIRSLDVEYYDFRNFYSDDKFMDTHHLNKSAAYEFTRYFWEHVIFLSANRIK